MKEELWQRAMKILGINEPLDDGVTKGEIEEEMEFDPPRIKHVRNRPIRERSLTSVSGEKPLLRVHIVEPTSFNDAQIIADKFKLGIPVIVNLSRSDREVGRRIIDFASGVIYALKGGITPIASTIYLLTPKNVEITPDEKKRLKESFFNQY